MRVHACLLLELDYQHWIPYGWCFFKKERSFTVASGVWCASGEENEGHANLYLDKGPAIFLLTRCVRAK